MTKYVVISGKKQHGKNTLANLMKLDLEIAGLTVTEVAFADPIKNFVTDVFGIPREDMETEEGKQKKTHIKWGQISWDTRFAGGWIADDGFDDDEYLTVRQILQIIGTDVFRQRFYDPIWAEAPFRRQYESDVVFITDCRFPNELEISEKNNATIIRVIREDYDNGNDTHSSETALDDYAWKEEQLAVASTGDGRLEKHAERFTDKILEELVAQ